MWDLTKLYKDDAEWEKSISKCRVELENELPPEISFDSLFEIFNFEERWAQILDKLYTYGLLRREERVKNANLKKSLAKVHALYSLFSEKNKDIQLFFDSHIKDILRHTQTKKNLKHYEYYVQKMLHQKRLKKTSDIHALYRNIEPYDNFISWYYSFSNIGEIDGKHVKITEENVLSFLKNDNHTNRLEAYISVEQFLKSVSDQAAFYLNTHLQIRNCEAKTVGFSNNFEYSLSYLSKDIHVNIGRFFKNYWEKMKNLNRLMVESKENTLQIKGFSYCDLYYLPGEYQNKVEKTDIEKILKEVLSVLDVKIANTIDMIFKENWINWNTSNGEHYGQRTISSFTTHPYIKLSWNGTLDNLFDIVHEVIGAIGQWFSSKSSFFYSELSILKTEFLSCLGTIYLCEYLEKNANKFGGRTLVKARIIDFIKDAFLVPFENSYVEQHFSEAATGRQLSSDDFSDIWDQTIASYHRTNSFVQMPENRFNWVRNEHFYLNGYDAYYVVAFIYASNYYTDNCTRNVGLTDLLKKGGNISDRQFFETIFFNKDFVEMSRNTYQNCKAYLEGNGVFS
ncbi:hypothetical protein [Lactiplantibacillus plantarum]|uniref:hypothetical protein n=1 Tax=Lactiplantibacillus plantarum TaxID=1590 RepID=UPI0005ED6FDF|nr:hypothetical protein [Lactiplantibacillus plantarum]KZV02946.1 Oligoendopeptidase F [Lactiplantibacillus plantarum]OEZ36621.1 hypothetical protein A6B36_00060 [Lactiplantibacillus plantarum]WBB05485.1 hypothetical protein O4Z47_14415 [Lactiplantibacillus plantarum]